MSFDNKDVEDLINNLFDNEEKVNISYNSILFKRSSN